jgi:hypothetical protein
VQILSSVLMVSSSVVLMVVSVSLAVQPSPAGSESEPRIEGRDGEVVTRSSITSRPDVESDIDSYPSARRKGVKSGERPGDRVDKCVGRGNWSLAQAGRVRDTRTLAPGGARLK